MGAEDSKESGDGQEGLITFIWGILRLRQPSFYLLPAIPLVAVLGHPAFYMSGDVRRYGFVLSLSLLFYMLVIFIGLLDCISVLRKGLHEQERLFRGAFGDREFTEQMKHKLSPPGRPMS